MHACCRAYCRACVLSCFLACLRACVCRACFRACVLSCVRAVVRACDDRNSSAERSDHFGTTGWTDEMRRTAGMDGRTDGRMSTDGVVGQSVSRSVGRTDGQSVGRTDRRTDGLCSPYVRETTGRDGTGRDGTGRDGRDGTGGRTRWERDLCRKHARHTHLHGDGAERAICGWVRSPRSESRVKQRHKKHGHK